jgi:hypothetical protein
VGNIKEQLQVAKEIAQDSRAL